MHGNLPHQLFITSQQCMDRAGNRTSEPWRNGISDLSSNFNLATHEYKIIRERL